MRFIIQEQSYETPIAAGMLRYARDGRFSGAIERWRLTEAAEGWRFLRVDLDARQAESGHTYLYHALLDENYRIHRLHYRFWNRQQGANKLHVTGNLSIEETAVISARTVNDQIDQQVLETTSRVMCLFPSSIGLWLTTRWAEGIAFETAVLGNDPTKKSLFAPQITQLTSSMTITDYQELTLNGVVKRASPRSILWGNNSRFVALDEREWLLKMEKGDGLTAVESRFILYQ